VGVVGRPEFRGALYPLHVALCLVTVTLPQQVPALTRPTRQHLCLAIEPEGEDEKRDYTAERAFRIPSINSTAGRVVSPGTGEGVWTGFAPTVVVSTSGHRWTAVLP
jgi:hypothetical protein